MKLTRFGAVCPRSLDVRWEDLSWEPKMVRRASAEVFHGPSVRVRCFSMGAATTTGRGRRAFTLIELLVVIAIIGILAGLLLPAVGGMKKKGKMKIAQKEVQELAAAIAQYESTYSRFPTVAKTGGQDVTFGLSGGNEEVIAILRDTEITGKNINVGHILNPQRQNFLSAVKPARDTTTSGISSDGVYRDPWGNPYVISMDLNFDDKCEDELYSDARIEGNNGKGLTGLVPFNRKDGKEAYALIGHVMVWSYGPDGRFLQGGRSNDGDNADNSLSWRP